MIIYHREKSEYSYAYIMSQEQSVDIDTEIDFQLAELLVKRRKQ